MKITIVCILFAAVCSLSGLEFEAKVVGVSDGDTITVIENSNPQKAGKFRIRLYGIDAPEKKQAFGEKSKQALSEMIFNKVVKIEFYETDRYGRLIGIIHHVNQNINLKMLENGMAWHYKYYSQDKSFAKAERQAQEAKTGLWQDLTPLEPWAWRKQQKR